MIQKKPNKGQIPDNLLHMRRAALLFKWTPDLSKSIIDSISKGSSSYPESISTAWADCRDANLKYPLGSLLIINCTAPLQRLHTPSKNIMACPEEII